MSARYQIGDIIYDAYRPQRPGKVIGYRDIEKYGGFYSYAKIKWMDGTVDEHWDIHLNSLVKLIEDHERKLTNHKKRLKEAEKIEP